MQRAAEFEDEIYLRTFRIGRSHQLSASLGSVRAIPTAMTKNVPPIPRGWFLRSAVAWERVGATISAPFAGVHIVEATKQVYRALPAREKPRLVPALEPVLAPSTGGAARSSDV